MMAHLTFFCFSKILLSIPVFGNATVGGISWILVFTCFALLLIAFGNGLFKGNLQAIVGQMYDNFEAEAAKKGEDELKKAEADQGKAFGIREVWINGHRVLSNGELDTQALKSSGHALRRTKAES